MTLVHGKTHRLYAGGHDLSIFFRAFSFEQTIEDADVTTFVDEARRYAPGMSDASASGDGITLADPTATRDIMESALGADGSMIVSLPTDTHGAQGFALPAFQAKWAMSFPMDDIVDVQAEWKAQGGAMYPRVALDASERTGAVNGASLDLGAGTHTVTLIAQLLALTTFTGVVVKVQDRASTGDAWVDVAELTTDALDEHDHATLTHSGVKRYVRCVATPAGTPGTFHVSAVLNAS